MRLGAGKNSELFPLPTIIQSIEVVILNAGNDLDKSVDVGQVVSFLHGQAPHPRRSILRHGHFHRDQSKTVKHIRVECRFAVGHPVASQPQRRTAHRQGGRIDADRLFFAGALERERVGHQLKHVLLRRGWSHRRDVKRRGALLDRKIQRRRFADAQGHLLIASRSEFRFGALVLERYVDVANQRPGLRVRRIQRGHA